MLHCKDIDGLMVDWLYGELEPARATEVSGHVDDCSRCQTEKAAFTRTREAFAALPELEPPSSLTAMLVREAALSAKTPAKASTRKPAAAESGGFGAWLTGLFRPLMHPAAAAIATLVVVVAVGGTLYLNKGSDQLALPTAPGVAATSDLDSSAISSEAPALAQAGERQADEAEPSALAKSEDPTPDRDEVDAPAVSGNRTAALLEKSRDDRLKEASKKQAPKPAKIAAAPKGKSKRRMTESPKDQFASGFADLDGEDVLNGSGDRSSKEGSFGYAGKKTGWVETKEAQLVTAFKKDDCKAAASIANDIRDRAPKHYKANTADLDAVKKCRYYVTSERKRRTAVARKRAKSKAKKTTGSKADTSKAAAAEAPVDDAADVSSESGL